MTGAPSPRFARGTQPDSATTVIRTHHRNERMRTGTVVLVVALVTLSGCSGLVPGGGNESGDGPGGGGTPTASPYAAGYAASA